MLGNHDLHLVMQAAGYGKANKEDTLKEILCAPDRDELLVWLRSLPLFHVEGAMAMVHAGLLPVWDVARAKALSDEVSVALTAPDYTEFLANMWGSEPDGWRDDLTGWDRLRVAVNAMTRMRFVTADGRMEFRAPGAKGPPERGPANCVPWFEAPGRKSADHLLVCGHWSALRVPTDGQSTGAGYRLPVGRQPDGDTAGRSPGIPDALRPAGQADRVAIKRRSASADFCHQLQSSGCGHWHE